MSDALNQLRQLNEESVQLCAQLRTCLAEERLALIALDREGLLQCTLRKEGLGAHLRVKREQFKRLAVSLSQNQDWSSWEAGLSDDEKGQWAELKTIWLTAWGPVVEQCGSNQRLIQGSLKNLGLIVDNLKRLFGESPLYSAKGTQVGPGRHGKVLEARY